MKYAIQCVLLVATLITAISWYRSYHAMSDWMSPQLLGSQQAFFVGADRGTIYTGLFFEERLPSGFVSSSIFPRFEILSRSTSQPNSGSGKKPAFQWGYFEQLQLLHSVEKESERGSQTYYMSIVLNFDGHGIYFPHFIVLMFAGTLFVLVTFGRRFTLRGLMIWITVVCLLMGIQIAAANYQPPQEQGVLDE